jgi:transcriptional regulator with XRE-family HTH domain
MRTKKTINIEIGANIQAARERAGYTQEELSEVLNITPNHMSAIERGASGISLELLRRVCRLLGISADCIIFGSMEPDEEAGRIARQLASVKPEYRPQIDKMLSAVLEISEIMQEGQ